MRRTVALAFRGVAVRCSHDRRAELLGTCHDLVEIGHLAKPQQDSITNLDIRAHKESVMVSDVSVVELKNERSVGKQPFVVRTPMITTETEKLLIPQARRLDIRYGDHGLGLCYADPHNDADAVAGWVLDLREPPLTAIELRPSADPAASCLDFPQCAVKAIGRDPQHRTARCRHDIGGQLTDQAGRFEASADRIDRPAKDSCVEVSRTFEVERWKLHVFNLAMRYSVRFSHDCSIDYGYTLVNRAGLTSVSLGPVAKIARVRFAAQA
jgi:hypothetical protein